MGRFGLVSLGHGGFMGVGAYVTALAWNTGGVSPWLGIPLALVAGAAAGRGGGLPVLSLPITGHYFALVTLALSGIVLQVITATRDHTGGSLGYTPERYQGGSSLYALQFTQQDHLVPDRPRRVGGGALRLVPRRSQHAPLRAGGDLRGRGRRGRRRRARDRGEAQDHRAQRRDDRARRRALLPVPDVHLARHGERHLHLAADGLRRRGRRASTCRSARPWAR